MRAPARCRAGLLATSLVLVLLGVAPALADGVANKAVRHSRSIGAPNRGRLLDGVRVVAKKYLRILPVYAEGQPQWGTRELADAIDYAAREVRKRYPDAVLGVGHLSRRGGGEIDRHHSHESGRDVDLAFYLADVHGRPVYRDGLVPIGVDGKVVRDPAVLFDDGRNWTLMRALIENSHARVTHVFIATHLRARLLAHGAKIGASPALRTRMAEVMMQPQRAMPHDDHFHVRVACPAGSPECIEWPLAEPSPRLPTARVQPPPSTMTHNGVDRTLPSRGRRRA